MTPLAASASNAGGKHRVAHGTTMPGTVPGARVVGTKAMSGANRAAASSSARSGPWPERATSASVGGDEGADEGIARG